MRVDIWICFICSLSLELNLRRSLIWIPPLHRVLITPELPELHLLQRAHTHTSFDKNKPKDAQTQAPQIYLGLCILGLAHFAALAITSNVHKAQTQTMWRHH